MKKNTSRNRMAVAVYDGILGFEFSVVNEILGLVRPGMEDRWYDFQCCRVERGELRSNHGWTLAPENGRKFLESAGTIVIPGWRDPATPPKPAFLNMLRQAHARGARLVSICTGAFVLGYAGLLEKRRCSTHWVHRELFESCFPTAILQDHTLYVQDEQIFTSAGSAAAIDLCLHLIRLDFGHTVATQVAKRMVTSVHREGGQSQFAQARLLEIEHETFSPVLDWILANLDTELSIDEVANQFNMSRRTFQRRFQQLAGMTYSQWLSRQRVELARKLLEATNQSIDTVAFNSGLGSAANLRKHFRRHLQTSPSNYRASLRKTSK